MLTRLVLILRSLIFYIGFYSGTTFISAFFILLFLFLSPKGRHIFASTWCGFVLGWLQICCGVKYVVYGLENLPSTPAIIFANHQSSWETILFYKLVFPVSPILKQELTKIPFWGWSMRLLKPIAIDRSNPREASRSVLVQGIDRIQNGSSVIVFPEGSRSNYGVVKRFSRGGAKLAIAASTGIIPIAHNSGYCWPAHQFIKRSGLVTVVIGEKMELGERDASELTADVEDWIRKKVDELS
jgi:1-acyl-sn-glycerol-3-phosphate acyltransferase